MSRNRWASTEDALRVAVGLVSASKVRSLVWDCPIMLRSDLVSRLMDGKMSRTAAYRLVSVAVDDGVLVCLGGRYLAVSQGSLDVC